MHVTMFSSLLLLLCLTFPVFLLFFFFKTLKNPPLPPGPKGLPIVGNILQLDSSSLHMQLRELSKKYGPLFTLKLGLKQAIVVSSPKLATVVMKDHDRECCGRPRLLRQQKLSYNGLDLAFCPYTEYWREIRKLCVVHVLSSKRVSCFSSLRHFEVKQMIKKISMHASNSEVTNLSEVIVSLTSTIICRIALGRRYEEEGTERNKFYRLLSECETMMSSFFVSDYIPFMGWVDTLRGIHARLERTFKEMDNFYQEVIDEHIADSHKKTSEEEDIVDVLLQQKQHHSFSIDLTNDNIKAVIMNMIIGSTSTTTATAVGAMTELVKNSRIMKKVQEEVRSLSGEKAFLDEDDVQKFPYLKAVIKETLRLHPPGPLLIPRETRKKVIIDDYEIPAKTIIYVNGWAIHRDPEAWEDAEEFIPERFLNSTVDLRGQDFCLIPFGAGRRMCPGLHMGLASLDVILSNLLYSFDWELVEGTETNDTGSTVLPGLTHDKKNPFRVLAKCRN
ncbi:cytochrome P450 71A1-like [Vigna unguiculata]|uniref:cytochrome P450 71A1-like n=1 Tax=Vigna unguiculata TaxID=3917 RepID=UPI00101610A5|nr:cytochrome P450 71A1-like [Vigna unguiculata]